MAAPKKLVRRENIYSVRLNSEDRKLIDALNKKLGVKASELCRWGLRVLAAKEGVAA